MPRPLQVPHLPRKLFRPDEPWPPRPPPPEETERCRRFGPRRRRLEQAGLSCCSEIIDQRVLLLDLLLDRVPWLSSLDPEVVLVSVADGCRPDQGAFFALATAWTCHSVDPELADRKWPIDHLTAHRDPVERVRITAPRVVVVSVNAHVDLAVALSAVVAEKVAVLAVPCRCGHGGSVSLLRPADARKALDASGSTASVWIDAADLAGRGCIDRLLPDLPPVPKNVTVHLVTPEQETTTRYRGPQARREIKASEARARAYAEGSRLAAQQQITLVDEKTGLVLPETWSEDLRRWRRRDIVQRTVRDLFRGLVYQASMVAYDAASEVSRLARWVGLPRQAADWIARAQRAHPDRSTRLVRLAA